ncbi:MAG: hypothetical protein J5505_06170 [Spirochaetaceae bacterium]|nr:hypothetical protein [Spirochaetaceae bacterium]
MKTKKVLWLIPIAIALLLVFFLITPNAFKKNDIRRAWDLSEKIDFSKSFDDNSELINEVLLNFHSAQNMIKADWEDGYVQEIQFTLYLYYRDLITKDVFMDNVRNVYDKYHKKYPKSQKNIFSYALFLYLDGKEEDSFTLLRKIYDSSHVYCYDMEAVTNDDVKNFTCGILLKDIDPSDFEGTFYDEFCYPSENDLMGMLQTTW